MAPAELSAAGPSGRVTDVGEYDPESFRVKPSDPGPEIPVRRVPSRAAVRVL